MSSSETSTTPRVAVITCGVMEDEVRHFAGEYSHVTSIRVLESGLHDTPDRLRSELQQAIDAIESGEECEVIVLVYGLCSRGTENLRTQRCRLVITRAHDCITILLGSKEKYMEQQLSHPGTYWYSPGWNRDMKVPGKDRYEKLYRKYVEEYGQDNADYLIEMDKEGMRQYDRAAYVDLGVGDAEKEANYCRDCAHWMGWDYARYQGDPALLKDLICGPWDNKRFLVLEPGETFRMSADENIIKAVKQE